ncbi:MAG TPA: hypothetical protein VKP65_21785 [Rhodothermales bacterium]|nr:hypothetical protein [Rhodothermales bacterium]
MDDGSLQILTKQNAAVVLCVLICCLAGCAPRAYVLQEGAPPLLMGEFEDDYGIYYSISAQAWTQYPSSTYHITQWHPDAQYLIAQNAADNPSDGGLWTRIDWIELSEMSPYEWAFCLSVYDATTAAEAEAATIVQRDTPRTGCNGYPFSRMKRKSAE